MRRRLALVGCVLLACSDSSSPAPGGPGDASVGPDATTGDASHDAGGARDAGGSLDANVGVDAAADAFVATDAGIDAPSPADAAPADAGADVAAPIDAGVDAAPPACALSFAVQTVSTLSGAYLLRVVDVNKDSLADIVVYETTPKYATEVIWSTGDGGLASRGTLQMSGDLTTLAIADFTGDGFPDMTAVDTFGSFDTATNVGNGDFNSPGWALSYVAEPALGIAVGDVDGDGTADIITSSTMGSITWLRGPTYPRTVYASPKINDVETADLDHDKRDDVVASSSSGLLALRGGDGGLAMPDAGSGPALDQIAIADFDGNGYVDVAVLDTTNARIDVAMNTAGVLGPLTASQRIVPTFTRQPDLVAADIDHDGKLDLLAGANRAIEVLIGAGDGTFPSSCLIALPGPGSPASIGVGDVDGDGKLDIVALPNGDQPILFLAR